MKKYDRNDLGSLGSDLLPTGASDIQAISTALNTRGQWAPILIVPGTENPRLPLHRARTLVGSLEGVGILKSAGKVKGTDWHCIERLKNGHYSYFFTEAEQLEWLKGATDWFARFNPAYLPGEARPKS